MNRGRSSESLSSHGSSSPTDFTSDDEISNDGFMTGNSSLQTNRSKIENRIAMLKSDLQGGQQINNNVNVLHNRNVNMYRQSSNCPNDIIINQSPSLKYERNIDSFLDDISGSTCNPSNSSYLSTNSISTSSSSTTSHVNNSVIGGNNNNNIFISSTSDNNPNNRNNHLPIIDNINTHRSMMMRTPHNHRRGLHINQPRQYGATSGVAGHSRNNNNNNSLLLLNDENDENIVGSSSNNMGLNDLDDDLDDDDAADLYGRIDSQIEPTTLTAATRATTRGMNSITIRMCARLLECRNLIEAIEFVEQNRILIDDLTRIITRDAPAFRNYNMANYQIDYTIKESFNNDFWLDREPIVTTADGNCQYHAVSLSLTGSELYTPEVRLATSVAVIDNREWFDSMLKLIDRGTVLDLVHTIARNYSWGDETTLKAIAVAINRRIFLYTCNIGKKDYEMVKSLSKEELIDAFREKKYRGGTGIHTYADPLIHVQANNYIMLFHKSEHFIAVLPTTQLPTMFEPYNPIVPVF